MRPYEPERDGVSSTSGTHIVFTMCCTAGRVTPNSWAAARFVLAGLMASEIM